jgi:acyl-CoA reductase-like NAD-dependent aldehyde dehydrogenase
MGAFQPLLAGDTVVYKLSEEVPMFGQLLDRLMATAKLPVGVFTQVYGAGRVGETLARSDIDAIFFTGSTAVGRKLYKIGAEKFIPVHLELGGSDAGIVCEDANIDEAVPQIFDAKFCNNGQICCGLKRLIVHVTRFDETVQRLATYIRARRIGDPLQKDTELGPLVAQRQVDLLKAQVEDARTQGATIVVGGREPAGLKGAITNPR